MDEQFSETRAIIQLSHNQLQDRVDHLEQRVHNLEQHP
jgi:hypothetical protein